MKASALALILLPIAPGCSAEADAPAPTEESVRVAATLPDRPVGPVLDEAELIPDEAEAALDRRLRDYWERNRTAVVVATVDSLGGEPIERFSLRLAEEWGIGDPENKRGLLLLVAPNERRVRIEVSCGLEGVISDVVAGRVIRNHIIPRFKEGALNEGTLAGVDALIEQLDTGADAASARDYCSSDMRQAA